MTTRKKSFIYLIASLIIIAVSLYFYNTRYYYFTARDDRSFSVCPDENISKITLSISGKTMVTLELEKDDSWIVNNEYKANKAAVSDLLRTLRNLYVRHPVPAEKRDSILELLQKDGITADIYAKKHIISLGGWKAISYNRKTNSIIAGDNASDGPGTYMKIPGSNIPYVVFIPGYDAGLKETFTVNYNAWRDRYIFEQKKEKIRTVKVVPESDIKEAYQIVNHIDSVVFYSIYHDEAMHFDYDTIRVNRFLSAFENLYFENLIHGKEKETVKEVVNKKVPAFELFVTDIYDNTTKLEVFRKKITEEDRLNLGVTVDYDPNVFYLRIDGEVYANAKYFAFTRVLRPVSFFYYSED